MLNGFIFYKTNNYLSIIFNIEKCPVLVQQFVRVSVSQEVIEISLIFQSAHNAWQGKCFSYELTFYRDLLFKL